MPDPLRHAALEAAKALEAFAEFGNKAPFFIKDGSIDLASFMTDEGMVLSPTIGHCRAAAAARTALLAELAREPWTREMPTQEGEYEWRSSESGPIRPAKIKYHQANGALMFTLTDTGAESWLYKMAGSWFRGPILCPAAPVPPHAARGGKEGEE